MEAALKPIVKNFSGNISFDYQVRYKMEGDFVILYLYVKNPISEDYKLLDVVSGTYDKKTQSITVGIKDALQSAEKRWGIKLLKEDLTQVA